MRTILFKISCALPMLLLTGSAFAGEPLPSQTPAQTAKPMPSQSPTQSPAMQQQLEQSVAVIVRVPLDASMQHVQSQAEARLCLGQALAPSDNFEPMAVWDAAVDEDADLGARHGYYPYFYWDRYPQIGYIYDNSFYGTHYPYILGNPYTYEYERPSHHGRFGRYDYYYYRRR